MKKQILKLAKRLKTFTLSELELIADCDCKIIVLELLKEGSLQTWNEMYEYVEPAEDGCKIIQFGTIAQIEITMPDAIKLFLKRYAEPNCKKWTLKTYISIFNTNIIPYFRNKLLNDLNLDDVLDYYIWLKNRRLSAQRTKNTMALLNQLVHYFQEKGVIDRRCDFKVQRIDSKKSQLKNVI